ncbi:hypothetical protein BDF20DRAFT_883225 [Mycotypha africana]|uniref:uncharacterized protein n=1 Tax=Mycotypha africana TaxID=64632 RepID=UPI0023018C17|nr:uncharacterized protein BDF20DRAFT_883225 [Mycotypha africana]KAI8973601.1 hypothetical protein BDF20DRAFT_883225 [Mycotypha africana]
MKVSDLLNPVPSTPAMVTPMPTRKHQCQRSRCISSPALSSTIAAASPSLDTVRSLSYPPTHLDHPMIGKPRSRFSEYEDNIIRQGVAQRLTWGQISDLLPHRKRATCFNRYRTLQGIRKSRKLSSSNNNNNNNSNINNSHSPIPLTSTLSTTSSEASSPEMTSSPTSPVPSCFNGPRTPPPPPSRHTYPPIATASTLPSSDNASPFQWFNSSADIIYDKEPHTSSLPLPSPPPRRSLSPPSHTTARSPSMTTVRFSSALYPRHFHDPMTSNSSSISRIDSSCSFSNEADILVKRRRLPSLHYPSQPQHSLHYHPRHSVRDMRTPQPFYPL